MGLFDKIHLVLILFVGAASFWLVNKLVEPPRLSRLLKFIVIASCVVATIQRTILLRIL
jgi:hypothetical protein